MPVLIELVSLVAPAPALRLAADRAAGHDQALGAVASASDGELTALAFADVATLRRALDRLEEVGLGLRSGQEPGELAIVDQRRGPCAWWPWLELAMVPAPDGGPVLAARRAGSGARQVAVPAGWRRAGSASATLGPCRLELVDRPLRHLRREGRHDLYRDRWTGQEVPLQREHPPVRLLVEGPGGGCGAVTAELVTRWEEIELGLMFREALAPDAGMLFRFERPRPHAFWMKNTLTPLDLLFLRGGRVVNVVARATPLTLAPRRSAGPADEVLEVPGGWCEARGVGAGAGVRLLAVGEGSAPDPERVGWFRAR